MSSDGGEKGGKEDEEEGDAGKSGSGEEELSESRLVEEGAVEEEEKSTNPADHTEMAPPRNRNLPARVRDNNVSPAKSGTNIG